MLIFGFVGVCCKFIYYFYKSSFRNCPGPRYTLSNLFFLEFYILSGNFRNVIIRGDNAGWYVRTSLPRIDLQNTGWVNSLRLNKTNSVY